MSELKIKDFMRDVWETNEAHGFHIDLKAAIIEKQAFNRTRPYLHGKKF